MKKQFIQRRKRVLPTNSGQDNSSVSPDPTSVAPNLRDTPQSTGFDGAVAHTSGTDEMLRATYPLPVDFTAYRSAAMPHRKPRASPPSDTAASDAVPSIRRKRTRSPTPTTGLQPTMNGPAISGPTTHHSDHVPGVLHSGPAPVSVIPLPSEDTPAIPGSSPQTETQPSHANGPGDIDDREVNEDEEDRRRKNAKRARLEDQIARMQDELSQLGEDESGEVVGPRGDGDVIRGGDRASVAGLTRSGIGAK